MILSILVESVRYCLYLLGREPMHTLPSDGVVFVEYTINNAYNAMDESECPRYVGMIDVDTLNAFDHDSITLFAWSPHATTNALLKALCDDAIRRMRIEDEALLKSSREVPNAQA